VAAGGGGGDCLLGNKHDACVPGGGGDCLLRNKRDACVPCAVVCSLASGMSGRVWRSARTTKQRSRSRHSLCSTRGSFGVLRPAWRVVSVIALG
jgi:hypothetical protein